MVIGRPSVAAEQFAVERVEIARAQRDRHDAGKRAVGRAPFHAGVEHLLAGDVPRHHLRYVFEVAALAKADEIVALADRHHRREDKTGLLTSNAPSRAEKSTRRPLADSRRPSFALSGE